MSCSPQYFQLAVSYCQEDDSVYSNWDSRCLLQKATEGQWWFGLLCFLCLQNSHSKLDLCACRADNFSGSNSTSKSKSKSSGISGAVIGAAVGGAVVLIAIVLLIAYLCVRMKKKGKVQLQPEMTGNHTGMLLLTLHFLSTFGMFQSLLRMEDCS